MRNWPGIYRPTCCRIANGTLIYYQGAIGIARQPVIQIPLHIYPALFANDPTEEAFMRKCILKMAVLFAALLALSFLYDTVQDLDYEAVAVDSAVADLTGFDFSDKIALIRGFKLEVLRGGALYARGFHKGRCCAARYIKRRRLPRRLCHPPRHPAPSKGRRLRHIRRQHADTAQRLYIDGVLALSVGSPGDTRESTTPMSRMYFYAFTHPASGAFSTLPPPAC